MLAASPAEPLNFSSLREPVSNVRWRAILTSDVYMLTHEEIATNACICYREVGEGGGTEGRRGTRNGKEKAGKRKRKGRTLRKSASIQAMFEAKSYKFHCLFFPT